MYHRDHPHLSAAKLFQPHLSAAKLTADLCNFKLHSEYSSQPDRHARLSFYSIYEDLFETIHGILHEQVPVPTHARLWQREEKRLVAQSSNIS